MDNFMNNFKTMAVEPSASVIEPSLSKPTIGYVVKRYPRFSETFIVNEILAHEAAGQPVEIFALRSVEESHFQDILGQVRSPVTRLPDKLRSVETFWQLLLQAQLTLPLAWTTLGTLKAENARDVSQAIMLAGACQERGIIHLHAHFGTVSTTVARLAAQLAGITYSFTAHAKDIFFDYDVPQNLECKLRDASHVVTVSDFNLGFLRDQFGPSAERVIRIYNGLDLGRFEYRDPDPDAISLLAVGRLVEKKGFHILVEAIRILADAGKRLRCDIIGTGPEAQNLQAQIDAGALSDCIQLVGPKPQSEVIAAMRRSAMLVCPCIVGQDGNRDGLPTVLLEAMALGLPCVGTDVTGIPELIVDNDTGLCVPEVDADALAGAIFRLVDDSFLRQRLARAGRARIEEDFDQTHNAAALRSIFPKAVHSQVDQVQEAV